MDSLPVTENELKSMADDANLFHVVCMVQPPTRPVKAYLSELERAANVLSFSFQLHHVVWENMCFVVATIPMTAKAIADAVAKRDGLRLKDGIPAVLDKDGERWFPMSSPRVWQLD